MTGWKPIPRFHHRLSAHEDDQRFLAQLQVFEFRDQLVHVDDVVRLLSGALSGVSCRSPCTLDSE